VDPAPVSRQAGVITSFAPVVEKVAPSVVQISTSKNVKGASRGAAIPALQRPALPPVLWASGRRRRDAGRRNPDSLARGGRNGVHKEALGLGSGVIVSKDGHILTNNHVIEGADDIIITLAGDKKEYPAKKIGSDPGSDLAVLKVDLKNVPRLPSPIAISCVSEISRSRSEILSD
jgi:serine protease Do